MSRWLLVASASALVTLTLSGCNATKRELTIVFGSDATQAQRESALRACSGAAPHATPEPLPTPTRHFIAPGLRFRIDRANDHDLAQLETCLEKQPGVRGFQDSADNS